MKVADAVVTGRKEKEPKHSQLLSIFDSIDEVIYVADPATNEILYANRAMQETFGKPLIGGTCYREIQGRDAPCEFCTNAIILKDKGKPYKWEFHNPTVNRDFLIVDRIIKWPDGRDVRFEMAIDITEQKQAERALRKSQFILAKSQEMAHVGNWAWNPLTGELNGSDENYRIFGYTPGDVVPGLALVMSRVHPDDRHLLSGLLESAQREGKQGSVDFRVVRQDGSVRYVNILADRIVRDRSGKVRWVYGITQDITDRKQTEKDLGDARDRAELYIDLMGHDINNMNQIAMGYMELSLGDPGISEETRKALSKSLESIRASSRLIRNVRKLQQVKTGGMSQAEMDVDRILLRVRDAFAKAPGIAPAVSYAPAPESCKVMADELLYDVFANLVDNAIKHCSDVPPAVDIRLETTVVGDRNYCVVSVEDNGPGIPDDLKKAIFERMRRGDTRAKGSGLGLYLVRTLVESYGGRVWVEDRVPGDRSRGSRFVVLLPAA